MTRKSLSVFLALAILILTAFTSCKNNDLPEATVPEASTSGKINITLTTFDYTQGDIQTRASASDAVSRIAFAVFDSEGTRVKSITQAKDDTGFGTIQCELSPGTYTLVAVGHKLGAAGLPNDHVANINAPDEVTLPDGYICDTYSATKTITVSPRQDYSLSMALPRIVSQFALQILDPIPAEAKSLEITYNSDSEYLLTPVTATEVSKPVYASFDPSTGNALQPWQFTTITDISSMAGASGKTFQNYLLLTSDEQTVHITATAYNTSHEALATVTLDAPLKRNRQTKATGNFFTSQGTGTLQFDNTWLTPTTISY